MPWKTTVGRGAEMLGWFGRDDRNHSLFASHGEARFAPDHPGVGNILRSFEIAAILPALPQVDGLSLAGTRNEDIADVSKTAWRHGFVDWADFLAGVGRLLLCLANVDRVLCRPWRAATVDCCGGILPGRHRPRYRHLVRRLVIRINVVIATKPLQPSPNHDSVDLFTIARRTHGHPSYRCQESPCQSRLRSLTPSGK